MGALRTLVGVLLLALAGCGGGDSPPQLVDGSVAASLPDELDALDGAVLTRTELKNESDLDQDEYEACRVPADGEDRTVVVRTGRNMMDTNVGIQDGGGWAALLITEVCVSFMAVAVALS